MDKSDVVFHVSKPWHRAEDPDFQHELAIRFELNRSTTAVTASTVNTTPVAMIAGPLKLNP